MRLLLRLQGSAAGFVLGADAAQNTAIVLLFTGDAPEARFDLGADCYLAT